MKWFAVFLTLGCLVPGSLAIAHHLTLVDSRIVELESRTQLDGQFLTRFAADLKTVRLELGSIEEAMGTADASVLAERLNAAEAHLVQLGDTLGSQADRLGDIANAQSELNPAVLEARLELHDQSNAERLADLQQLAVEAAALAEGSLARVEALAGGDPQVLWRELVGPVVQLAGESSVGSGVLLESQPNDDSEGYTTYLLTAWHVVRDIQGDLSNRDMPVPVTIYRAENSGASELTIEETATLLEFDATLDVALLQLDTLEAVEFGTHLAPPDLVERVRTFHEVIAVGCPLGNDPIPTRGEVASVNHQVDDESYWMINAPTYIGNSGGAIFDEETHGLLGIFSKIYTHGSLRPTVVPHMGLVTPMGEVYDWMDTVGFGALIPANSATKLDGASLASGATVAAGATGASALDATSPSASQSEFAVGDPTPAD